MHNNKNLSFLNTQPSTKSHSTLRWQLNDQNKNEECTNTKSYTFSQFDIHKVKKLKINSENEEECFKAIAFKSFSSKYKNKQEVQSGQQQSDSKVPLSQMEIE